MYQAVCHYGTPHWSEEERAFAAEIRATLSANDIHNSLKNIADTSGDEGKAFARGHRETILIDEVAPWAATDNILAGSTDVGDVSWKAPVAQCFSPCFAVGTPLHTWQLVSQGSSQRNASGGENTGCNGHSFVQRQVATDYQSAGTGTGFSRKALPVSDPAGRQAFDFKIIKDLRMEYSNALSAKKQLLTRPGVKRQTTQQRQLRNAHEYVIHTVAFPHR